MTDKSAEMTTLPVLPLRDIVVFPHMIVPLFVGREKSVRALESVMKEDKAILLASQRDPSDDDPSPEDVYEVGAIANVLQLLKLPDGTVKVLVEGKSRAKIEAYTSREEYFEAHATVLTETQSNPDAIEALSRNISDEFEKYVKLNKNVPQEAVSTVSQIQGPAKLADTISGHLGVKLSEKQSLLEMIDIGERLERIYGLMQGEISVLQVEKKIKTRVKSQMERTQREYYLNEQMKAIQKELGEGEEGGDEVAELEARIKETKLSKEADEKALAELKKLRQMSPMSAEATVVRNYLDWMVALPWSELSEQIASISEAAAVLDADHFGLRKIKERVLEYLAVATLVEKMRGPILCLVGPPGVGKTSLAAVLVPEVEVGAIGASLGGVRDEAEIRGHRRTYIGAMPGKLLHAMKRSQTVDPVLLLDEIDKMSADFRGDPSAALLEVLDPEQNYQFNDHYLDLDYDLSKVTFICTANSLQGIPLPLQDRLEIIELSGYTEREKIAIARRYLLPRQIDLNGLSEDNLTISNQALLETVQRYTKESGVRNLERQIARICRKVARRVVTHGPETHIKVVTSNLQRLLGAPRFLIAQREKEDQIGLVKGLAVSPWGGELLNIEVATVPGKGQLQLTGRLGDWLKESGNAAFTYIRSRAAALGLEPDFHDTTDLHIHYPGNALRTDGPSAGIAMATAMVSALTGIPARADTAMTGEISLRGRVLPIGGLKEKVLAAHRGGITRVIAPEENRKDLEEIPANVTAELEILFVSHMDRVLKEALPDSELDELFRNGRHRTISEESARGS